MLRGSVAGLGGLVEFGYAAGSAFLLFRNGQVGLRIFISTHVQHGIAMVSLLHACACASATTQRLAGCTYRQIVLLGMQT